MASPDPLVLTLQLEPRAQERFNRERQALFPAGRTQVEAHVTLFHALPGEHVDAVAAELATERRRSALTVLVTGVRHLGRGAAYTLDCPELVVLRDRLAMAWRPWLTAQDRQPYRPHITVQNKVDPAHARATVAELTARFTPLEVVGTGLELWHYRGGPWEPAAAFPFTA